MKALFAFFPILLAACAAPPKSPESGGPVSTALFEDVPAPKGAEYRDTPGESYSFHSKTFRCGHFVYDYDGTPASAVQFYKQTMTEPPYSWSLTDEQSTGMEGSSKLVFYKGEDRCAVQVDQLKHTVRLTVDVNIR